MNKLILDELAAQLQAGLELAKSEGKGAVNAVLRDIDSIAVVARRYNPQFDNDKWNRACGLNPNARSTPAYPKGRWAGCHHDVDAIDPYNRL